MGLDVAHLSVIQHVASVTETGGKELSYRENVEA